MPGEPAAPFPDQFNIAAHFVDRPAREHPNRVAIVGEPSPFTYGQLAALTNRVGNALLASGCQPDERFLIVLTDSAEFIAAFFGAAKIGATAVPVNPMTRAADYAYYAADCGARLAIVQSTSLAEFLPAIESSALTQVVVVGQSPDALRLPNAQAPERAKFVSWESWIDAASPHLQAYPTAGTDTAFFLYTSGSGGQPKAVIHQHKDMRACTLGVAAGVLGLRSDDRTFSVSKLFFAYGLGNGMYFPFSVGASTVLNPDRPRVDKVVEIVARHHPTVFFSVPTFYAALLRETDGGLPADFSSVRLAVSAGEALPAEIFLQFKERFGLEILDGIGSTEMLQMFVFSRPGQARPGSCGFEVPGYSAQIVDDAGQPVPAGEIGNLWVKGGSAFAGYWNKPQLTARAKRGDWVATGDKFRRDADGYYYYCGRADDMLKVAGMWVSPGEVENAVLGHPQVAEAAVIGAPDATGLLHPVAYVVLRDAEQGSTLLASEIREFVKTRVAGYKCPQEVRFLPELPKTATGKIQRYLLREWAGG